jgi:hypothetical protein
MLHVYAMDEQLLWNEGHFIAHIPRFIKKGELMVSGPYVGLPSKV